MIDPHCIHPIRHKLLVRITPLVPSGVWFPGIVTPTTRDYAPLEVPAYVRKRLVDFLEGRFPLPPRYLRNIIPAKDAGDARRIYHELRESGCDAYEAICTMGLLARPTRFNLPESAIATIIARSSCGCISEDIQHVVVSTTAGEPLDSQHAFIRCWETGAAAEPETAVEAARRIERAERARRAAFDRIRFAHTG